MDNYTELNFIWEISRTLSCNNNPQDIINGLKINFNKFFNINELQIIFYDEKQNSFYDFENFSKNFEPDEENNCKNIFEQLNSTMRLNFILNNQVFIINDDFYMEYKLKTDSKSNVFYLPLTQNYKCIGYIKLSQSMCKESFITKDFIKVLFIVANSISDMVMNRRLANKITKIADFYKAQKNIAKILETQYDYSFLIPIIGEILDNFAKDYFTYIFMKNPESDFELAWPLRYDKKKLDPMLKNINIKNLVSINTDGTAALFPIYFENVLQGAIIIDGKKRKIMQEDMDFLIRLSAQTATTLDKAGVYAEIEKYATLDALTGLNNRRSLDLRINQEIAVAKRKNLPLCVMMLDIDFFKKINDTYGHYVGDIVLKSFAQIIKEEIREYDFPARYGGEEFFIILPSTTMDEALAVANRLREKIENKVFDISKFHDSVKSLNITTSIGLSELNSNKDVKNLYLSVDKALYEAKKTGRNKVVIL